ncbi:pilin [Patescibacteria group bacterium]|nr:pilin [Patescibacteria group bacterium]
MKKTLPALIVLSLLAVLFLPMVVAADTAIAPTTCKITRDITLPGATAACPPAADIETQGGCCLIQAIYNVTDWIFVILVALATVFVILGAIFLLTAAGAPERISTGRNYIIYAVVGLAVGFLAKAVPSLVKLIVGIT